jgi:membrane protease YdiL (CAAX protease family)
MTWVLAALLVVAVAVAFALRLPPPTTGVSLWLGMALPYAALGLVGVFHLRRHGLLRPLARFRPGDPSLGIGSGVLLLMAAWALSRWLLPPDSLAHAWVLRLFLAMGDVSSGAVTLCLIAISVLEELVWRGWVQSELSSRLGPRRGWMACALLYAVAHAATLVTLADPLAGPNPLVVLRALGSGLCWSFLRERTGRIMPGLFSHATCTYLATQYLGRFV